MLCSENPAEFLLKKMIYLRINAFHLVDKYLLDVPCVPGTVLGTGDVLVKKTKHSVPVLLKCPETPECFSIINIRQGCVQKVLE